MLATFLDKGLGLGLRPFHGELVNELLKRIQEEREKMMVKNKRTRKTA